MIRLNLGINAGTQVRAGQAIASITARNISGGDADNAAKVAVDNAKRELDRVTPLLADGLITKKNITMLLPPMRQPRPLTVLPPHRA